MPATTRGDSGPLQAVQRKGREEGVPKVLLACGSLSGLVYLGSHEPAVLPWDGHSRVSNAISELHLTGSPSKWLLDPWEGLVYNPLVIAFGDRPKANSSGFGQCALSQPAPSVEDSNPAAKEDR